jgi:hypothetical protein
MLMVSPVLMVPRNPRGKVSGLRQRDAVEMGYGA